MGASSLKEMIKKIPGLHSFGVDCKELAANLKAVPDFLAERRIRRPEGPVKVGFLCQYLPAWAKIEPIYLRMKADPRFEPYLLCVPNGIENCRMQDPQNLQNDVWEYMLSQGYPEAINTLTGPDSFLDLSRMGLSYLFYTRPYNSLLPGCYGSRAVSRYCRVCILMYGATLTTGIVPITLNRDFMSHVYCYFAETHYMQRQNKRINRLLHGMKLSKTPCLGMPGLEALQQSQNEISPAWDFSHNKFRVIWAPRWTTDIREGGSNFFTYYRKLLDYAREHSDTDFLFRPHPLAFAHFLETGELTQQELDDFLQCCDRLDNVSIDRQKEYNATLWGSSVLVGDISGLLPEYLSTGKPLIFCASNMHLTLHEDFARMIEACYVVYNEKELFACLDQLRRGIDPLAEKRRDTVKAVCGNLQESLSQKILDFLVRDKK